MASEIKVDKIQNVLGTQTLIDSATGNLTASEILAYDNSTISFGHDIKLPTDGGIKDSGGVDILRESGGHINMGSIRLPTTGGIRDSSGNNILTESGGNVSVGNLRLPTSGGIKDSSGNNILTESGGEITIGSDVNIGTSSFGFLQLNLANGTTFAGANALTILDLGQGTGDTTNITKPSSTSYRIGVRGIYLITFHATFEISGEERYLQSAIQIVNPGNTVSTAFTHIKQADSTTTYATAACIYTGYFSGETDGTSDVQFSCVSGSQGNANITNSTYASIVLIRRTA